MLKHLPIVVLGFMLIGLAGCKLETPEIRGVVLDVETKEPVEGAWVSGTIGVKTKTVAGDVGQVISLGPPHTRTDKDGKFVVPSKSLKKPPFPVSFGTEIDVAGIGARTVDDRGGGIELKGEELKEFLEKDVVDLTIYIKAIERTEIEYFSHLQSLYNYCLTGRFGIEIPPVEGGCDEWELNYAITKHERYLERWGQEAEHAGGTLKQLGYLYKKKGDYVKANEAFKKTLDYDKKRNIRFRRGEVETQIKELEQLLIKGKQK